MSNQLNCPKCGQVDMVQKVSTIYFGGITTTSLSGPSVGGAVSIGEGQASVGGGLTTLKGGSQSLLSNRLAPPPQPSAEGTHVTLICAAIAFLCIGSLLFIRGFVNSDEESFGIITGGLALFSIGIAICGISYNAVKEGKREAKLRISQWEKAMTRWNELYFCARDDGVFDPNERKFISTSQMMDYISR